MSRPNLEELLEFEHAGWTALCESRGASFYAELMAPDGLMVLVDGTVLDHDDVAASLADAPPWATYEIREPRIVGVGSDSTALVYRSWARRPGEPPFEALMSSVYRTVDNESQLVLYQQTPVPR